MEKELDPVSGTSGIVASSRSGDAFPNVRSTVAVETAMAFGETVTTEGGLDADLVLIGELSSPKLGNMRRSAATGEFRFGGSANGILTWESGVSTGSITVRFVRDSGE
jgi:hypothetical protein